MNEKQRIVLFYFSIIFHISAIVICINSLTLIYILLLYEIFFYFLFKNSNLKKNFRMIILFIVIFLANLFYKEGKVLFSILNFEITDMALFNGLKKSALLLILFIFTGNLLKDNKELFINIFKKNELITMSIFYFYLFFDIIQRTKNINLIIKKIIVIYRRKHQFFYAKLRDKKINNIILYYNFFTLIIIIIKIIMLIKNSFIKT